MQSVSLAEPDENLSSPNNWATIAPGRITDREASSSSGRLYALSTNQEGTKYLFAFPSARKAADDQKISFEERGLPAEATWDEALDIKQQIQLWAENEKEKRRISIHSELQRSRVPQQKVSRM